MKSTTEILLHTKDGFVVRVESEELKDKFMASTHYQIINDCPLNNFTKFISEVMNCLVPEPSLIHLQQILMEVGHTEHKESA